MTAQAEHGPAGRVELHAPSALRRLFRDRPLIPLTALLVLLVVALRARAARDRHRRLGRRRRSGPPIPLAILAACQTLAMLTGGIDLSVGAVASMAAFLMATQTGQGPASRSSSRSSPPPSPAS